MAFPLFSSVMSRTGQPVITGRNPEAIGLVTA